MLYESLPKFEKSGSVFIEDEEDEVAVQLNKLVNMPFRRRKATVWDKMRNMTAEELKQEHEVQHIQYLLDHWILMKMENEISQREH